MLDEPFYIVNEGLLIGNSALQPFAFEEVIMREIGRTQPPIIHIWQHTRAFIVGLRDRKLPHAHTIMEEMRREGIQVAVRNSGGAAVPLHAGVVNISAILPKKPGTIDIYEDFTWMAQLLKHVLTPLGIHFEHGEIIGSYCPGEFDLSIQGKKFCGIAQRRQTGAYSIQAFVNVEGSGSGTAELAKRFYEQAADGEGGLDHPLVRPETMASLQELTMGGLTVERFVRQLLTLLANWGGTMRNELPTGYESAIRDQMEQMRERYDSQLSKD